MGPIPQPTSNQYRPPQSDTNPNVRKDKATEKRKRAVPTKRFRPNTASRPSETAMCPPTTISKAPINVKNPKQMFQEIDPHPWKMPQSMKALHGTVLERCQGTSLRKERIGCFFPTT